MRPKAMNAIDETFDDETFDVWQIFDDGTSEQVRTNVRAQEAVEAARHYCTSVGARLGLVEFVRIISRSDDYCCFRVDERKGSDVHMTEGDEVAVLYSICQNTEKVTKL